MVQEQWYRGAMWGSPGRREMEGTNDCTVGRRQRPDIAHKASVKTKCTGLQGIVWAYQRVTGINHVSGLATFWTVLYRPFCVNAVCHVDYKWG